MKASLVMIVAIGLSPCSRLKEVGADAVVSAPISVRGGQVLSSCSVEKSNNTDS